jgi:hypothetical protein
MPDALRATRVTFSGGGETYPAHVRASTARGSRIRPLFTRRTVNKIIEGIRKDDDDWAAEAGDIAGEHRFHASWTGDRLIVDAGKWVEPPHVYRPVKGGLYAFLDASSWAEVWPAWPKNPPTAPKVVSMLRQRTFDRRPLVYYIRTRVPISTLIEALNGLDADPSKRADDLRSILATAITMHEPPEPAVIADLLRSPFATVRAEAAHAASHTSDATVRSLLPEALRRESDPKVREVIEMAMGG